MKLAAFRSKRVLIGAVSLLMGMAVVAYATDGLIVPSWVGHLLMGNDPILGGDPTSPLIADSAGPKFELLFTARQARDPQNPPNQVISMNPTTSGAMGIATRKLIPNDSDWGHPGINIGELTNQLQLKYFFPIAPTTFPPTTQRTCSGGSPRIQLSIDLGLNNNNDPNAFGYVGHGPFNAGCLTGVWDFIDMTDNVMRWDFTAFPPPVGPAFYTWSGAVAALNAAFPNHRVLRGALVDDSGSIDPAAAGLAFYDLVTIGHRTLENWADTVKW